MRNFKCSLVNFIVAMCLMLVGSFAMAAPCSVVGNFIAQDKHSVSLITLNGNNTYSKSFVDMETDQVVYSTPTVGKWEAIKGCAIRLLPSEDEDFDRKKDDDKKSLEIKFSSFTWAVNKYIADVGVWAGGSMHRIMDR